MFTTLPPHEVERRRVASIEALALKARADFDAWYQEECDRDYWSNGPRCSGCDFWDSSAALTGECTAAGIVSGDQVLASMGVRSCSYTPPPGFPVSGHDFWCGKFKDDFDWESLDDEYLARIGAMREGKVREKPTRQMKEGRDGTRTHSDR